MDTHISAQTYFPQRESSCCLSCCSHSIPHNLSREGMWPCLSSVLPVTTPPQACSRSDRNSAWREGPGEGEDSGDWVAPRVGLRILGDKHLKRTAGGASGTQTPALQLHMHWAARLSAFSWVSCTYSRSQHNPVYAPGTSWMSRGQNSGQAVTWGGGRGPAHRD